MLGGGIPHPRPDGAFLPAGLCFQQLQQLPGVSAPPAVRTDGQMADLALRPSGRVVQKSGNAVRVRQAEHLPGSDRLPELFIRLLGHLPLAIRLPLPFLQAFLCCLLEITGGIAKMSAYPPLYVLALLPLGGLSFILQAGSILKNAGLSLPVYLLHKLIQTVLIFAFYVVIIHAGF